MSEFIKHECGLALIRLLKPLSYYQEKYGTSLYGLNKLQILLQKQRNRGQDGAGIATIKLNTQPGKRFISRRRSNSAQYLKDLFTGAFAHFEDCTPEQLADSAWLKDNKPYTGELLLGHLRYGTHGKNIIEKVHPFLRQNNWISRNLVLAGNFNLTNVNELFEELVELGQYPKERSDTVTVLEKIGHFLDDEVERLYNWFKAEGYDIAKINELIAQHLDVQRLLQRAARKFDGGYVMAGLVGHGDAFVLRDPAGIRPAFFYEDDEVVVMASERPAIQTAFDLKVGQIQELERGHALIIKKDGTVSVKACKDQLERKACSFERIYFSRGTDKDIYQERKKLGKLLVPAVLKEVNYDYEHTVFSFIPNTAEVAFYGFVEAMHDNLNAAKTKEISEGKNLTPERIQQILSRSPRVEKLTIKDEKLRTFIADESIRGEMVSHIYDVTYGLIENGIDTVVVLDDSIVRGTTLRDSIIEILSRLEPKKIVVISSAPQIRYPDCYGIDMSKMGEFVAFQALIALLKEQGKEALLGEVYQEAKGMVADGSSFHSNAVQKLYDLYSYQEVSDRISLLLTPENAKCEIKIIYQTIEDLQSACPDNNGDWFFSGNYPTSGGNDVVNRAFVNYMEKRNERAY
ncbi:MAG: amidophosphoribosyltransferase [Saprospiraceae bacterium]|jgi:amidophosphoribosyltransferase